MSAPAAAPRVHGAAPPTHESDARTGPWILLALVAAVLATYAQVGGFEFVRYDDPDYVRDNPAVNHGFSWAGIAWAFGAHASNWHPLTWFAHMLDAQLYGLAPGGHHWSSVLLHALASALCFLALRSLSGRTWPSALVAALFALHPLRVESVAWVSERKDVLSGCLFFALLLAYARYARDRAGYARVLALFALGLCAKPMLVSAPLVLLLLDLWPLGRLAPGAAAGRELRARVLEKLPLVLLAALSALVTLWSQREGGSLNTLEAVPLAARLANAPLAVLRYAAHFVWPSGLAYFYPHPAFVAEGAPAWSPAAIAALALLVVLCVLAWLVRHRAPCVFVGWAWFLVMLLPVIGIVQVGEQALADRYAYLPVVGLQIALSFGLFELVERRAALRKPLVTAAGLALVACGLASARQARTWHDSEALFRRALLVTERNYPAWLGLANELADQKRVDEARASYAESLAIRPAYGPALYGLGLLEQRQGENERALELYRRAIAAQPGLAATHLNLGTLLANRGEREEAAQEFERVLALFPGHPDASFNLAQLELVGGEHAAALEHLLAVVRAVPAHTLAWEKLGVTYLLLARPAEARGALERAVIDPARSDAARLLADLLARSGEPGSAPRALELARRAANATQRRDPRALEVLARALAANGDFARAAEVEDEAVALLAPAQQARGRARAEAYRRGQMPAD